MLRNKKCFWEKLTFSTLILIAIKREAYLSRKPETKVEIGFIVVRYWVVS